MTNNHSITEHPYCAYCGYDLYGIESKVCPECGNPLKYRGNTYYIYRFIIKSTVIIAWVSSWCHIQAIFDVSLPYALWFLRISNYYSFIIRRHWISTVLRLPIIMVILIAGMYIWKKCSKLSKYPRWIEFVCAFAALGLFTIVPVEYYFAQTEPIRGLEIISGITGQLYMVISMIQGLILLFWIYIINQQNKKCQ
jgi:hypothetical protein